MQAQPVHPQAQSVQAQTQHVGQPDSLEDQNKPSSPVAEVVNLDPFRLPKPADYEESWYEGEDGLMYNEYDYELEEGYYYSDQPEIKASEPGETKEPTGGATKVVVEPIKGLPRPSDYEDFWYKGEDGVMYNEYDDELQEGQFYAEAVPGPKPIQSVNKAEDAAAKAASEASKAAEEAAKAAAEASTNLLKGMSGLGGGFMDSISSGAKSKSDSKPQTGFGFGGLGGLFGGAEPAKKPVPNPVQPKKSEPKPQIKPASTPAPAPKPPPTVAPTPTTPSVPKPEHAPVLPAEPKPEPALVLPTKSKPEPSLPVETKPLEHEGGEENLFKKPYTAGMTARQRWRWACCMSRQVTPAEQVISRTRSLLA